MYQTLETVSGPYNGIDITADGSKIVYSSPSSVLYSNWNGNNYGVGTNVLLDPSQNNAVNRVKFCATGINIFASNNATSQTSTILASTTWNGSGYNSFAKIPPSVITAPSTVNNTLLALNPIDGASLYLGGYSIPASANNLRKLQVAYPYASYIRNAHSTNVGDGNWHNVAWSIDTSTNYYFMVDGSVNKVSSTQVYPPSIMRTQNSIGRSAILPFSNLSGGLNSLYVFNSIPNTLFVPKPTYYLKFNLSNSTSVGTYNLYDTAQGDTGNGSSSGTTAFYDSFINTSLPNNNINFGTDKDGKIKVTLYDQANNYSYRGKHLSQI
jgi:hypothetical protein